MLNICVNYFLFNYILATFFNNRTDLEIVLFLEDRNNLLDHQLRKFMSKYLE